MFFSQKLFEEKTYIVVFKYVAAFYLVQTLFDFANEPFVVIDHALDGFKDQRRQILVFVLRDASELGFKFRREIQFHSRKLNRCNSGVSKRFHVNFPQNAAKQNGLQRTATVNH